MARLGNDPWDITTAFAQQLMKQGAATQARAEQVEFAPIEQGMLMERLKRQKELELQSFIERQPYEINTYGAKAGIDTREHGTRVGQSGAETRRTNLLQQRVAGEEHRANTAYDLEQGHRYQLDTMNKQAQLQSQRDTEAELRRMREEENETARIGEREAVREPFQIRRDERALEKAESVAGIRADAQKEVAQLRADEASKQKAIDWANKNALADKSNEIKLAIHQGKLVMDEPGVFRSKDIVEDATRFADKSKWQEIGPGKDPKGNTYKRYKWIGDTNALQPSQRGDLPSTGLPPGANRATEPVDQPTKGKQGKSVDRMSFNGSADEAPQYAPIFQAVGKEYNLNPDLLASVAKTESSYNPRAVSPAGARGITQFMPGTARDYGVNTRDPASSIRGTAEYLNDMLDQFGDNLGLALAGYNGGPHNVEKWLQLGAPMNKSWPRQETIDYVQRITGKPLQFWAQKYKQKPRIKEAGQVNNQGEPLFYVEV